MSPLDPYQAAQRAIADLKAAVRQVLAGADAQGLKNAEIGRILGIYQGYGKGEHEGHISRALLAMLEEEGVATQNPDTKRWALRSQASAGGSSEPGI